MIIDTDKITPNCELIIAMEQLLSRCGCKHKSGCLADNCRECLCSYYNGHFDHLLIPLKAREDNSNDN